MKNYNYLWKVKMTKYNYEDKVWVYVDPRNLIDDSEVPVFECTVDGVEITSKASYGGEESRAIEYTLSMGFDTLYRKGADIFPTKSEATKAGLSSYKTMIDLNKRKLEKYEHVYNLMEQEVDE